MLGRVLAYLRNYFEQGGVEGTFNVTKEGVEGVEARFIRITGSMLNDGVYDLEEANAFTEETFTGRIDFLAIPKALQCTVKSIEKWSAEDADRRSPYTSESFGGYSYSRKTNADGSWSWKDEFADELKQWRKL